VGYLPFEPKAEAAAEFSLPKYSSVTPSASSSATTSDKLIHNEAIIQLFRKGHRIQPTAANVLGELQARQGKIERYKRKAIAGSRLHQERDRQI